MRTVLLAGVALLTGTVALLRPDAVVRAEDFTSFRVMSPPLALALA